MKVKEKTLPVLETKVSRVSWVDKVINYVVVRQNEDGGYAFAQGLESNLQDTYYGLTILDLLSGPFPNIQKTLTWLHDFSVENKLNLHYYVTKALMLLDESPSNQVHDFMASFLASHKEFGTTEVFVEVASEFEVTFMVTELANILKIELNKDNLTKGLLRYKNDEGGFGAHGHSNLNSTYHAAASLNNLRYPVRSLKDTLAFVRSCEKPSGGFTVVSNTFPPYMEHVYYGVFTLDLLGGRLGYPEETAKFVFRCQNPRGGFARSDIGIPTFEDTFYAVNILRKIGKL